MPIESAERLRSKEDGCCMNESRKIRYRPGEEARFTTRLCAHILDGVLISIAVMVPYLAALFYLPSDQGRQMVLWFAEYLDGVSFFLMALYFIGFWHWRGATPGKLYWGLRVVDAKTADKPALRQLVLRYLGYYISVLPFYAGYLWALADERNQGWHDKIAGTVVMQERLPVFCSERFSLEQRTIVQA